MCQWQEYCGCQDLFGLYFLQGKVGVVVVLFEGRVFQDYGAGFGNFIGYGKVLGQVYDDQQCRCLEVDLIVGW